LTVAVISSETRELDVAVIRSETRKLDVAVILSETRKLDVAVILRREAPKGSLSRHGRKSLGRTAILSSLRDSG